jgi:aminoglycoside phosphotransferase (APT) family kinase protein
MDFDEIAEASNEASCDAWFDLFNSVQGAPLSKFVSKFRDHKPCWQRSLDCGSFNFCCQFAFADGVQWLIRFPMPGKVMYLAEKIRREVATMKFIHAKTQIRIPKLIAYGMEDDLGLGPFIITEFIRGKSLDKLWKENPKEPRSRLRLDIDEKDQETVYRQVANILLELAVHKFDRIGSLSLDDGGAYSVTARPLTLKMNEVTRVGGVIDDGKSMRFPTAVSKYILHH